MVIIKSATQIQAMRKAGLVVYDALSAAIDMVKPGVSTLELDRAAEKVILSRGAIPSFKGYNGFPNSLCISVDDEVVHGIPSASHILQEGSIVSLDCGAIVEGMHGDSAITVPVGAVSDAAMKLMRETRAAFFKGIAQAINGNRVGDISSAVQKHAESFGYGVVRALCGHGVGENLHEDPEVPNYGSAGHGLRLKPGMTIAVEPMIAAGRFPVELGQDGWRVTTRDHQIAAHYEHTLLITQDEPVLLTVPEDKRKEFLRECRTY